LSDCEADLRNLATYIENSLRADKSLIDTGWAWADLGDCLALIGQVEDARRAYLSFISKAELKSPERTLNVLKDIAMKLKDSSDPGAARLQVAIETLERGIVAL
jgi:hypothetical protein